MIGFPKIYAFYTSIKPPIFHADLISHPLFYYNCFPKFLHYSKTNRRERCWNFDDKFVGFGTILLLAIVSLLIWHLIFYEWKFDTYDYDNDALL